MYISTWEVGGIIPALQGMRNPMNSWKLADTIEFQGRVLIGEADLDLAQRLIKGGGEHRKFLRMIMVWFDAYMPRYFWQEFDTYHFNTKNSTSTMHKLMDKNREIKLSDFAYCDEDGDYITECIDLLNKIKLEYNYSTDSDEKDRLLLRAKRILPEGYLQLRTVCSNYEEVFRIYHQRKHHRLKEEWSETYCKWVESLPYFKEFNDFYSEKQLTNEE